MVLCRELSVVKHGFGATEAVEIMEIRALTCKCWTCEYCRPMRQKQLRAMGHRGKPNAFLTLTVNPAWGDGPDHRARELVKAWRHLVKCAKKETKRRPSQKPMPYGVDAADWRESHGPGPHRRQAQLDGAKLPFMAVFERTKKGEPHLHLLLRVKWLDQKWISAIMDARMNAPIVDIRRVKGAKEAAAYVSKYVGKEPTVFEGTKRYWRSQDWIWGASERVAEENKRRKAAGLEPLTPAEARALADPYHGGDGWSVEISKERYQDLVAGLGYQGWVCMSTPIDGLLRSLWGRIKGERAPPSPTWKEQYRALCYGS